MSGEALGISYLAPTGSSGHFSRIMSAISGEHFFATPSAYLAAEELSEGKNEYVDGVVFARPGGTVRHSEISGNISSGLDARLRRTNFRSCGCDFRVHLTYEFHERFYYPDASVVQLPIDGHALFVENPTVIFEVLSPSTERFDNEEKKDAYLRCESLQAYVLVHSERVEVTIYTRRVDGWDATIYNETTDTLPLPCIECELPLSEIYEE